MNRYKTQSEGYFAKYLRQARLSYKYEQEWGGKKPDFTIYGNKSKTNVIAITDVKNSDYTKQEKRILRETGRLIRNTNPFTQIRKKIHSVRKQFLFAKDHPCIPIIYSVGPVMATPIIVFGAMLGDIGISIPIRTIDGIPLSKKTQSFFGKYGKMIDEKHGKLQNQTITAIGILGHLEPEAVLSGFHEELKRRLDPLDIKTDGWIEKANLIGDQLRYELKTLGYNNLNKSVPYIDFVVNPFARLAFPKKFFQSGYTYIHEYDLKTGEIKLSYDWSVKSNKRNLG